MTIYKHLNKVAQTMKEYQCTRDEADNILARRAIRNVSKKFTNDLMKLLQDDPLLMKVAVAEFEEKLRVSDQSIISDALLVLHEASVARRLPFDIKVLNGETVFEYERKEHRGTIRIKSGSIVASVFCEVDFKVTSWVVDKDNVVDSINRVYDYIEQLDDVNTICPDWDVSF
jgi:hypothetical protein